MAEPTHSWLETALMSLSEAGYRNSGGRRTVLDALARQRCAMSAREIEDGLRERGRDVGRATIYRSLEQLAELHLVNRVDIGDGTMRYEPRHPGGEHHHHHLVCDTCGAVSPFEDEALEKVVQRISRTVDFRVDEHEIVLHGACRRCR